MITSKDAKKVIKWLDKWGTQVSSDDVYEVERGILHYYPAAICSAIPQCTKRGKVTTVEALQTIYKALGKQRIREGGVAIQELSDATKHIYRIITTGYLVDDFNFDALKTILIEIPNMDTSNIDIRKAILSARQAGVFSIPYLMAILQHRDAVKQARKVSIHVRHEKIINSIPDIPTVEHLGIDGVVTVAADLHDKLASTELIQRMRNWEERYAKIPINGRGTRGD